MQTTDNGRQTRQLLVVVIALQGLLLVGQWSGPGSGIVQPAQAQISDPGAQRIQMIDELKSLNTKMDKLIDVLGSGALQVKVKSDDEKKE